MSALPVDLEIAVNRWSLAERLNDLVADVLAQELGRRCPGAAAPPVGRAEAVSCLTRIQNLPSVLRGIVSDEEIRNADDLAALSDAATEIEVLRRRVRDLDEALSEAEWKLSQR